MAALPCCLCRREADNAMRTGDICVSGIHTFLIELLRLLEWSDLQKLRSRRKVKIILNQIFIKILHILRAVEFSR
jgi:hypothetical protein